MTAQPFLDQPPESPSLTDYDREHLKLYARLLDAVAQGADWRTAVMVLFEIEADHEPNRARQVYDAHLKRAQWMTEIGYNYLLGKSTN